MKTKFLAALFVGATLMFMLQSVSGGPATYTGKDRTGSPGVLPSDCTLCHPNQGAFSNPQLEIIVKNNLGTVVSSYIPGNTYTLEFVVSSGGTPVGYGMQAVVLDSSNNNAGDMVLTSTPNTQLATLANGREFIEHDGTSLDGRFVTTWEAPMLGTGAVTIYGIGIAVDGVSTSGDNTSPTTQLVLTESFTNSVDLLDLETDNFDIFPIPNDGSFKVKNRGAAGAITIDVLDLQGRTVYSESAMVDGFGTHSIYCKNLIPGTYMITIKSNGVQQTQQMMVF
ncbi:T9SS type A sorting domain-containing protein [Aureispira anguillae]|uniref:T9SS type A sorting domain-containing protein n=1 Tax=Aureispira anguillae TaxID=2864201 RepID=A0A916DSC7_9BACT|nr:T9SS type A sorting domain-containing protein [Aureispira anguillae]BDS11796.1 T9SS type A sorting domain-containing protein [Aureispira anguillae]